MMSIKDIVYNDRKQVLLEDWQEAVRTGIGIEAVGKRVQKFADDLLKDEDVMPSQKESAEILKEIVSEFLGGEVNG